MKALPLFLGLLLVSVTAFGRETAYKALRAFGTERGQALLSRVVEVQGRAGTPQPSSWKIILDDPNARGGVREVEIENSQIIAEHTPLRLYGGVGNGAVMDFQKLSLDSEGAFKIANMEAKSAQFGFDSIDYTLRVAGNSNVPVWALQFLDENQKSIGSIVIAADTGAVLSRTFGKNAPLPGAPSTGAPVPPQVPQTTEITGTSDTTVTVTQSTDVPATGVPSPDAAGVQAPPAPDTEKPVYDEHGHRVRIGHEIKKGILSAGAAMEEFLTGKRTLDRKYREPDSAPTSTPYRGDD